MHMAGANGVRPGRDLELAPEVGLAEVSSSWKWGYVCRPASQSVGSILGGLVLCCAGELFLEETSVCFVSLPGDLQVT